ncbi:MAG: AAA family ATPase [Actinomycetota bacterium]|nr:AAA family ATPase [Actinomycetota bacterium]
MGARPPRGFLLVGAPGCGKTLLARAVANEANVAFFSVAATQFVEIFAGEGAARVRDLFAEARSVAPAIVFIDEVDAIGARRGMVVEGQREREQTLNQILIELDGFDAGTGVIVMAASNRPEILDEALIRPGRFDRTITIGVPDRAGRGAIVALHAQGKPWAADFDVDLVAAFTQGYSGADLANVVNEAALLATRQQLDRIPMTVVEAAIERVGMGVAKTRVLTAEDRKVVAYHEAGHALVGLALPGARKPHKISIVARGHVLGAAWHHDDVDRLIHSRSALIDQMAGLLGGRAAEELVFGEPGSGAADDLVRVGDLARHMVCQLGMSAALGPMSYPTGTDGTGQPAHYSEHAAAQIDAEVRRLVDDAYGRAHAVLDSSRPTLDLVALALLEHETLVGSDLASLVESSSDPGDIATVPALGTPD